MKSKKIVTLIICIAFFTNSTALAFTEPDSINESNTLPSKISFTSESTISNQQATEENLSIKENPDSFILNSNESINEPVFNEAEDIYQDEISTVPLQDQTEDSSQEPPVEPSPEEPAPPQVSGWVYENSNWYYINPDGSVAVGWLDLDGRLFYLNPDGTMVKGWVELDTTTYYFDEYGALVTGWLYLGNSWYYLNEDGARVTGWLYLNNYWYYLDESGAMSTGWEYLNNRWYYLNEYGCMVTGWLYLNNYWYYLDEYGAMATGWLNLNNNWYFLYENGVMASNTTIDGYILSYSGLCTNRTTYLPSGRRINVPYISQKGVLPTGCETVSATMLLRYYGYDTTIYEFVDNHLKTADFEYIDGKRYAPTPDEAFIGNPRSSNGFGCFPPVIKDALDSILGRNHKAKITTGTPLNTLINNYINNGQPVLLWATINMLPSYKGASWYTYSNDSIFTWTAQEHCLVLVGYDNNKYYFNDPYNSNGIVEYSKSLVEARFQELGMRSLVII